jgi:hypothetical protein
MESRLYGPGRHQSFPVIGVSPFLLLSASPKVQTVSRPRKCRIAVQFPRDVQDAFQHPGGAFVTTMVI